MPPARYRSSLVAVCLATAALLVTGCGAPQAQTAGPPASDPTSSAPVVSSPTVSSPSPSDSPSATDDPSESATGSPSASDEPSDEPSATDDGTDDSSGDSTTPPDLGPSDAGRTLSFRDLRNRDDLDGWADDTYKVGNKPTPGIGGEIRRCGHDNPVVLDLRPAQQFTKLTFVLGQDADRSDSTDQILVAQVLGNDKEVLVTKKTKISGPTTVSADIDGVVATYIALYLDDSRCEYGDSVFAVISQLKLQ